MEEKPALITTGAAIRLTLAMGLIGIAATVGCAVFRFGSDIRAICGGVGCVLAPIGLGVGVWSSVRLRSLKCAIAAIPAVLAIIVLAWMVSVALRP